jgi:2-dehydro-3-deoxygalactonokinase
MIGVDWGTSSFRAFRLAADGTVHDRIEAPRGIMTVLEGGFPETLRELIRPWLRDGENRVLMGGMVGSRQGWVEAAYLPCPAAPADLARALTHVPFDGAQVRIVPGLSDRDADGVPEVMRGEETQLAGIAPRDGLVCLPGSHAKWARMTGGTVAGFATYLSGEAFAALRAGTILGRTMPDAPPDAAAFARGVARSGEAGHLLHHLFGVRTKILFGTLAETEAASYFSGLLIGHEVRAAMPVGAEVRLIGAHALCALYATAIAQCGGRATIEDENAAARGLAVIGEQAGWT